MVWRSSRRAAAGREEGVGGSAVLPGASSKDASEGEEEEEDVKRRGFVQKRRCTDVLCAVLYVAHIVAFVVVSFMGMSDGNPAKLISPRDYQGAYCGIEKQWNNGSNLKDQTKQSFMMNVPAVVEVAAKQLVCSTAARDFLLSPRGFATSAEAEDYLCECCLKPCARCTGSEFYGGDVGGSLSPSNFAAVTARMVELTDPANVVRLFSPSGANGDLFSSLWQQPGRNFHRVCLPTCAVNASLLNRSDARQYAYAPPPDHALSKAWSKVAEAFNGTTFLSSFTFQALPGSVCPYPAELCVPFPGVELSELASGYCSFGMSQEVVDAVGSAAASIYELAGGDAFAESTSENLGMWLGDFERSLDTFILICMASFIIGLVYLVLLRFTVRLCVWFAIFVVFLAFGVGGGFVFVRGSQCKEVGFFDAVAQTGVALVTVGTSAVSDVFSGTVAAGEECTGDCADYRGRQVRTRSGLLCQAWDSEVPHNHSLTHSSALFPHSGLNSTVGTRNNFCRNPYHPGDPYKAMSIWCFTASPETRWELCSPIGILQPECVHGYVVAGESARQALKICAYVIWSLSALWLLLICCLRNRIRLAIALNEVAAKFLSNTPSVLAVPIMQAFIGCAWVLVWTLCACFLLSQVPDSYTPTGFYESYDVAHGTEDTPGKCNERWPQGFAWRTPSDQCDMSDPLRPKCWRCAPPRFILDWRFAISFFSLLWNNAFLIAFGQCVIAGAVGVWFFTPNSKKGWLRCGEAVRRSNYNVWRYHTGSLAFGSFIIALVQFVRYVMKYFEKQAAAQRNRLMALILRVLQCCIYCFERFLKFLNKNAYIQVAIRGTPFCTSAEKAFEIILANMVRFGTVAILGHVIHVIGFLFIMAATLVSGYFLVEYMHPDISPAVPMIAYTFMSYVVGRLYMNVFGLAVDTCLQCVIFAEERCPDADFVPKSLRRVLDRSRAKAEGGAGAKPSKGSKASKSKE